MKCDGSERRVLGSGGRWKTHIQPGDVTNSLLFCHISFSTSDSSDGCVREWQEPRNAAPLLESLACAPANREAEGHWHRYVLHTWGKHAQSRCALVQRHVKVNDFISCWKRRLKNFFFFYSWLQRSVQQHQQHRGGSLQRAFLYLEPHWRGQGKQIIIRQKKHRYFYISWLCKASCLKREGTEQVEDLEEKKGKAERWGGERRSGWRGRGGIPEMCLALRRLSPQQERAAMAYSCGSKAPRWGHQTCCRWRSRKTGNYQQKMWG